MFGCFFCCPLTNNNNFALNLFYVHLVLVSGSWQINCKILLKSNHSLRFACLVLRKNGTHIPQMVVFDGDLPGFYTKQIQVHNRSNIIRKVPIFKDSNHPKQRRLIPKGSSTSYIYNIDILIDILIVPSKGTMSVGNGPAEM